MPLPRSMQKRLLKGHKYGAVRTTCLHGHNHASKKEAMWCVKLHQLQKEGKIKDLKIQERFSLDVGMSHICDHIVDFYYTIVTCGASLGGVTEVKGMGTPEWKLKKKLFNAIYPHIQYEVV